VGPLLAPSIYNPVIDDLKADLHATETQIGLSLSMYILYVISTVFSLAAQGLTSSRLADRHYQISRLDTDLVGYHSGDCRSKGEFDAITSRHNDRSADCRAQLVYIVSYSIYTVGCIVASRAPNMQVLIAMRVLQAFGSSAVVSVGAGSLADMFEPHERGRKVSQDV